MLHDKCPRFSETPLLFNRVGGCQRQSANLSKNLANFANLSENLGDFANLVSNLYWI